MVAAPLSELNLAAGVLQGGTQYFWRVTAQSTFGSQVSTPSVAAFTTQVPPPLCPGDLNGSGTTDVLDFAVFSSQFGTSVTPGVPPDYDADGQVTVLDFSAWVADFGCGT